MAMATGLGARLRATQHQGTLTDRKAALYVSSLVRQAARLLHGMHTHGVPILRANEGNPGRRVTHYVIRSDQLAGPPAATRLLVVGSDGRLRCCMIATEGGARLWVDYDVATAPDDLSQRVVLQALSTLIGQLERTVTDLEIRQITREAELEADIAMSKARIAGLTDPPSAPVGTRTSAISEEPARPWTRHGSTAARLLAQRPAASTRPERETTVPEATPDAAPPVSDDMVFPVASADVEVTATSRSAETPSAETRPAETRPAETSLRETPVGETSLAETPVAATPVGETPLAATPLAEPPPAATTPEETPPVDEDPRAMRRRLVLKRLGRAI
jgi:hypothetical protein